ncbi:unnamed protein product [marine sediment metagenome]|uniref:Uncharacterized protein n=1 Tax=marine sediment metagenome TaxID=412755 RepID=X1HJH0_9ZZZZ
MWTKKVNTYGEICFKGIHTFCPSNKSFIYLKKIINIIYNKKKLYKNNKILKKI